LFSIVRFKEISFAVTEQSTMSSPKQTAPITDEPTITTIPVGESATQQATSPETARHDAALAMATAEPTMAATPSTDAPIATASAYQADTPLNPTIAELPANSTPSAQPTTTTTTTTHLQLPQTTPSTSPPLETGLLAATDGPLPSTITTTTTTTSPSLSITLLLPTGARHPYTLDEKYLRSRKVSTELFDAITGAFDPRLLSGYQLKELIWIDWRAEWEARPANPSFIRLIVMGRLVEDKGVLKGTSFLGFLRALRRRLGG
jgi:hypothetical protein